MLRIQQLLNPEQIDKHSATQPPPPPPPPPLLMSSIMSTNMTSTVAFPPHAILSRRNGAVPQGMAELAQCHDQFQVSLRGGLSGRIQDSRRRIPYSSDRRGFLARTGREAFESESPVASNKHTLTYISLRVRVPGPRRSSRRQSTFRHVGLRDWSCPCHTILQSL